MKQEKLFNQRGLLESKTRLVGPITRETLHQLNNDTPLRADHNNEEVLVYANFHKTNWSLIGRLPKERSARVLPLIKKGVEVKVRVMNIDKGDFPSIDVILWWKT